MHSSGLTSDGFKAAQEVFAGLGMMCPAFFNACLEASVVSLSSVSFARSRLSSLQACCEAVNLAAAE